MAQRAGWGVGGCQGRTDEFWLRSAVFTRDSSARKNRTDCRWLRFVEYTQRLSARKSGTDYHWVRLVGFRS